MVGGVIVVAEHLATGFLVPTEDQDLPVIVRDLMAKMADEGALGLSQVDPEFFTLHIVGFADIDGDKAIGVPGEDAFLLAQAAPHSPDRDGIGFEIEAQFGARIRLVKMVRQTNKVEIVKQPSFGRFQAIPLRKKSRHR